MKIDKKTLERFNQIRENTIKQVKKFNQKKGKIKVIGISGSARSRFDMAGEDSNSEFLLNECLKKLKKLGAQTELIPLRDYNLQHCKACYSTTNTQCHFYCSCYPKGSPTEDDMTKIMYDKILEADIIIFATPVNNFKISSLMALFLDRCISLDGSLEPANPKAAKNIKLNIEHTKYIESHADQKVEGSGFFRRFRGKVAGIIVTGHEEGASMVISQLFMTLNHFGMIFCPWSNMYAMSSILYPTFKDKKIVNSAVYINEAKILAQNTFKTADLLRKNKVNWQYDYTSN